MMKNNRIRHLITIGICFLFTLSLFACGTNTIIPSKTSEPTAPSKDDITTVSILFVPPIANDDTSEFNALQKALPRIVDAANDLVFHDLGLQVSITLMNEYNYGMNRLQSVTSGDYDLLAEEWYTLRDYAKDSMILDLKPYLEDGGSNLISTYEFPELVTDFEINGGLYGLPAHQSVAAGPAVLFNKWVFTKYGLDASKIRTFEDIDTAYQIVAASEPEMYMAKIDPFDAYFYPPLSYVPLEGSQPLVAQVGDIENDAEICCLFETNEFMEWAEYLYRWNTREWLHPKSNKTNEPLYELVGSGEVFSFYLNDYNPADLPYLEAECGTELIAVPLGDAIFTTQRLCSRYFWMIPSTSRHPESAARLLEYMNTSTTFMNLLNWGQENRDYVVRDDNLLDYPSGSQEDLWHLNKGDYLLNQYILTPWAGQDPHVYDNMQDYSRSALRSSLILFEYDESLSGDEYIGLADGLLRLIYEHNSESVFFPDPASLSQVISEMHEHDLDKFVEECQIQAKAFLEEK